VRGAPSRLPTPALAHRLLYLTLEHFGLGAQTSILDGGLRAWKEGGRPLDVGPAPEGRGSLPPLVSESDLLVDFGYVAARVSDGEARVMDARDPPFWSGELQLQLRSERPGRIPGAVNVPFRALVSESGHFLGEGQLQALLEEEGVQPGERVVTCCHVGQQASLLAVAALLLGHPVRLYDGSWEEWSRLSELPAEMDQE